MSDVESCIVIDEQDYKRIRSPDEVDDDGAIELCKAIMYQLIDDYKSCVKYMKTHTTNVDSKKYVCCDKTKREIEAFVRTEFFHLMFDMDGRKFLTMIEQEFNL